MIVMDSSGWVEIFGGGPRESVFRDRVKGADRIIVPAIVHYEVYRALERKAGSARADQVASYLRSLEVVSLDAGLAEKAARVAAQLKLAAADAIVYATAQELAATVVTGDADFATLKGVDYIPLAEIPE